MENKERTELQRSLLWEANDNGLNISKMYEISWLVSEMLANIKRWVKYSKRNRAFGFSGKGEHFPETVLTHLQQKFFFGAQMIAQERIHGFYPELSANAGAIFMAFSIYGYGVALHGDVAMMDRKQKDLDEEAADFERILKLSPKNTRDYIRRAYLISRERDEAWLSGKKFSGISTTGRFLWAVVVATFVGKSLCEIERGNFAFVNTFHNLKDDIELLCRTFYSFNELVGPRLPQIQELMQKYPRWEEKE
ncbi:MAG: hypothetical protein WC459_04320 [Patescibacteria group bacterium]